MFLQERILGKFAVTNVTNILGRSIMGDDHVSFQIVSLSKFFNADGTLVRFFSCVGPHMSL